MIIKPFNGVIKPCVVQPIAASRTAKICTANSKENMPTLPWQRLEATRQWLLQQGKPGKNAADTLLEQVCRLRALEAYCNTLPEGETKRVMLQLVQGKLVAIPV